MEMLIYIISIIVSKENYSRQYLVRVLSIKASLHFRRYHKNVIKFTAHHCRDCFIVHHSVYAWWKIRSLFWSVHFSQLTTVNGAFVIIFLWSIRIYQSQKSAWILANIVNQNKPNYMTKRLIGYLPNLWSTFEAEQMWV